MLLLLYYSKGSFINDNASGILSFAGVVLMLIVCSFFERKEGFLNKLRVGIVIIAFYSFGIFGILEINDLGIVSDSNLLKYASLMPASIFIYFIFNFISNLLVSRDVQIVLIWGNRGFISEIIELTDIIYSLFQFLLIVIWFIIC